MKGFPEEIEKHPLWVLDNSRRDPILFIVSETEPDFSHIIEQAGRTTQTAETAPYHIVEKIEETKEYLFKIKVNPVIKNKNKRIPLVQDEKIISWLINRSQPNGFEIIQNDQKEPQITVLRKQNIEFQKKIENSTTRTKVTQHSTLLQGKLRVTNVALFKELLIQGLGPNKSYGCGLMLIKEFKIEN